MIDDSFSSVHLDFLMFFWVQVLTFLAFTHPFLFGLEFFGNAP